MDVRELLTLFTFKTDEAGLKQQESRLKSAIENVKSTLSTFGTVFGAQLAFDTAKNVIVGLADGIKEANRIKHQIGQILTPDMDLDDTMDKLFKFAQEAGENATSVAQDFRTMAIAAAEVGVSQETALEAMKNVSKAIDISKLSGEQAAAAFDRINMALRRGQLSGRTFGEILQGTPEVAKLLAQNMGLGVDQVRALADDGKITTEVLIKEFSKANKQLDAIFEAKPVTLGEAFTYVNNEIIKVGQSLWKLTTGVGYIARQIIYFTDVIVRWGTKFVDTIGGGENAVRLFGYAIAVAFGAKALQIIFTMTSALRAMGIAATVASIKFLAIAAAIAAIALGIDDLVAWFQGRDSLIGRLIGPVENFSKQIDAIASPFKALKKIFEGDFSGAFTELISGFQSIDGWVVGLIYTAEAAGAAFIAWNAISFTVGLIKAIVAVITQTGLVKGAIWLVNFAYRAWNAIDFGGGLIKALVAVAETTATVTEKVDTVKDAFDHLNSFKFTGLITSIGLITAAFGLVIAEKKALDAELKKTQDFIDQKKAEGKPTPTVAEIAEGTKQNVVQARQAASSTGLYKREGWGGAIEDRWQEFKRDLKEVMPKSVLGVPLPEVATVPKIADEQRVPLDSKEGGMGWLEWLDNNTPEWVKHGAYKPGDSSAPQPIPVAPTQPIPISPTAPPGEGETKSPVMDWLDRNIPPWMRNGPVAPSGEVKPGDSTQAQQQPVPIVPVMPPGAIGPTTPANVDNSVSVTAPTTNNISISAPVEIDAGRLAAAISQQAGAAFSAAAGAAARNLTGAMPATEARTGQ